MLKGIDIILYEKTKTGEDGFHDPIYEESPVTVHNVLVGQPTAEEITTELQLTGRRIAYTLAIPKGDTHNWDNVRVAFFGQTFRTCGGAVRKGVRQLLQSPEMENALTGIAFAAQNRLGEGYKASYYKASTRVVAKVSAESPAARKENADTNSILKALK